jgi:predicted ATPase
MARYVGDMTATAVARGELLLDREAELGVIGRCLDSACAGNGSVLLVEGPAGIGTTELLLAARREATARRMVVAGARGAELESEIAFGVVRQLLEPIVSRKQGRPLFEGAAALARSVFEADVVGGPSAGWAERSFAVLHGLYWLCATLAERAPLQLVVDDAHWADPASLEFLVYLGRRVSDLPVALVVASRPAEEADERERLLVDLRADPATATLHPRPLGSGAVGKLVEVATGHTPGETFVSACRAATDGNPFLMRELVRELRDRAIDPSDEAAEQVRELGPRSVARRLLSRLRSLPPVAVPVARAAAVLGRDGQARDIAALVGITPDEATAALDALAVAGIVTAERPVQFVHPIVRSAIYADIPAGERAALHARATEALQDAGAPLEGREPPHGDRAGRARGHRGPPSRGRGAGARARGAELGRLLPAPRVGGAAAGRSPAERAH